MSDGSKPRPVSGEIMTGPPAATASLRAVMAPDTVDAEFEAVVPAAGADSRAGAKATFRPDTPPVQGMDMLRRVEAVPRAEKSRHGGPFFWLAGLTLAAAAFWVSGGHTLLHRPTMLVSGPPGVDARLRIHDVSSRLEQAGDRILLLIDGEAVNDGHAAALLPPIQIRVDAPDGRVTRYNLGTAQRSLAPGGRFSFSSRLQMPGNGVKSVSVDFRP